MKNMKGPWKYDSEKALIRDNDDWPICQMYPLTWRDEEAKNKIGVLIAAALELCEVLKACEWMPVNKEVDGKYNLCPYCLSQKKHGHAPDCKLAAALKKAEGIGK